MDITIKNDIKALYTIFNFDCYKCPLSRINRLTGVPQNKIEELLGVCQLTKNIDTNKDYREFIYEINNSLDTSFKTDSLQDLAVKGFLNSVGTAR